MKSNFYLIMSLLLLASCNSGPENKLKGGTRSDVLKVDYVVTRPEPLINSIQATGSILPGESAELTTQAAGKVDEILFEEGERVQKGQVILKLDNREWQAQLQRLRAELETANKDLERKSQLAEVKGISETELEAAQLRVQTLEANMEETEVRLSYSTIKAPFSGRIGLRSVSPGAYINAGTAVATLVQENPLKLEFNVPERYAAKIAKDQPVSFTVNNVEGEFTASVYATEPMINVATRAMRVRAVARNSDYNLIPGAYADVVVTLDSIQNAMMLPTEAIIPKLDDQLVYRIKDGQAEEVKVKTGVRQPNRVQVSEGLQMGDTIMVTGLLQVKSGMAVAGDKEIEVESFDNAN